MGFPKISNTAAGYTAVSIAPLKRVALDIPSTVDASGLSRAQIYKDLRAGKLVAHKNGSRTLIFLDDLETYLRRLPRAQFKPLAGEGDEAAAPNAMENNADHSGFASAASAACMTVEEMRQYRHSLEEQK